LSLFSIPGIRTDFLAQGDAGMKKEDIKAFYDDLARQYPVGRVGEVDDVVKAVAYLASDDASFVCGSNFFVDGAALWSSFQFKET